MLSSKIKLRWRVVAGIVILLLIAAALLVSKFGKQVNLSGFFGAGAIAPISVPEGFEVSVFAEGLKGPRFIAFDPYGMLYVADRQNDRIVALPDKNGDGIADEIHVFAEGLNSPHSLVFHEGAWFVGVPTGIVRLEDTNGDGTVDQIESLIDDYPTMGHSTRTVLFLPDGRMIVSVGSSCNVCEESDERRGALLIYDGPQATGERVFASGLRNAVGLDLHPETGEIWAVNNGRDLMGDELPPETLYIVDDGKDYGWPRCHSGTIEDPDYGFSGSCAGVEAPLLEMQAHSAPLGMVFYDGQSFPEDYHGDLFMAFHGSWNRSEPTGYKIVRLPLDGSTPSGPLEDFATGWMDEESGEVFGRPVGLAIGPDSALYISDDKSGIIYRIARAGQ
jgi:glucose/arabinose dehydrogenase